MDPDADRAGGGPLRGDRVVEVAGRDRVDREGRERPQIQARKLAPAARLGCLAQDRRLESPRQATVEHQSLDHIARVVGRPEATDDLGAPAVAGRGERDQHQIARLCA
ncbi:MAG: hypothetical protein ABSH27_10540 [Solirubrobacteraceae bacterium]